MRGASFPQVTPVADQLSGQRAVGSANVEAEVEVPLVLVVVVSDVVTLVIVLVVAATVYVTTARRYVVLITPSAL